jgi:isopenicillin N synthase-like dioxygenase
MASQLTSHHTLPAFPSDIKTAPLVSVSLAALEAGDKAASDAFFAACKDLGFFYLDMLGSALGEKIVRGAEELNAVQKVFFQLPHEVKEKYGREVLNPFYAYRHTKLGVEGEDGVELRKEDYNVSVSCLPLYHLHVKDPDMDLKTIS